MVKEYWWILVIVLMVGVLMNVYKDLKRIDHKKFLDNKPELPPHRDFNDKWDDEDDWPKRNNHCAGFGPCTGFYINVITSSLPGVPPLRASSK